ncbi:dihydroxyacetone kinase subunit DhaL [Haloarchaeobius sp. HRN-SO-5]|uniref:dihydroxyacetone kinase subunit DhaL n=1 Tax=Haloarchaeobius sp. HRN-SO-5 TaxID=3446118 RepID=UPI003EBEB7C9
MVESAEARQALFDALENIATRMESEREYLTELDSAIGDADHGTNMNRGFQTVLDEVDGMEDEPLDEVVKTVGMALVSEVGGAAGPLYGGSIVHASQELSDGLTGESAVAFAEAYLEKVTDRGGASVGAKTMVDALTPAVHTFKKSIEQDDLPPVEALAKALDAAERGVAFTTPIRAQKGRASYLGWRSVGHQDPGATSTLFIVEELVATAREYAGGDTTADATAPAPPDDDEGE